MPWDALDEGLARLLADGRLLPANRAMHELVRTAVGEGGTATLATFGVDRAAGEVADWSHGERHWRVRVVGSGDDTWLVATEFVVAASGEDLAIAGARARALAGLAGAFVHDLNNHLNLALALAGQLRGLARDPDDTRLLDQLAIGTQQGAQLARALARMLRPDGGLRQRMDATQAAQEAVAAVAKPCAVRGVALATRLGSEPVFVRAAPADLGWLYLQQLLALVDAGAQALDVASTRVVVAIAGGRARAAVQLQARATGMAPAQMAALQVAAEVRVGTFAELGANEARRSGLVQAAMLARHLGGELQVHADAVGVALTSVLPTS